jgi:protein TonB
VAIVRGKNPEVDLKLKYRKVFWICTTISFVLHVATAVMFPTFDIAAAARKKDQIIIQMEDIPETQQIKRPPPPPRPAEPIETESEDVPDDVTIESTDIDFDEAFVDLPPPPPPGEAMEDEIMEFWKVEQKPVPIKTAPAVYPDIARKAELEGKVFVQFIVGTDGRVRNVRVLRGPEIFRKAAIDAVRQFVFRPAVQNDKPVQVQMVQPISFTLRK